MKESLCLLDLDYLLHDGKPVLRLWAADAKGTSVVVLDDSFRPYFYVEPKPGLTDAQQDALRERILGLAVEGRQPERVEEVERDFLGKRVRLLKVTLTNPGDVPKLRDQVKDWDSVREQYEYTIPFARRYLIDRKLAPMGWFAAEGEPAETELRTNRALRARTTAPEEGEAHPPLRILAFDIEVVEKGGEQEVIMISVMDSTGFSRVLSYGTGTHAGVPMELLADEAGMLAAFARIVSKQDPHIVVGYNSDRFDFPRMEARAKKHGVLLALGRDGSAVMTGRRARHEIAGIRGRVHIDLYDFVERILRTSLESEVLSLDRVAKEMLGFGKLPLEWKDIERAWREQDLATVARYCLMDSELALKLAEKLLPQVFELSRVVGQTPFDTTRMYYSQMVEWLLVRRAFEAGILVPNRPKDEEIQKRRKVPPYTGGYVHQPAEGIFEKIAVLDFSSLYPTITITHNVSPETLNCQCCGKEKEPNLNRVPEQDHVYCTRHKGFVPAVLEDLLARRRQIKERLKRRGSRMLDYRQQALKVLANASYGYYAYAGSRWYSRVCAESIAAFGRMYIRKVIGLAKDAGFAVVYGDTDSLFLRVRSKRQIKQFLAAVNGELPGVMEVESKGFFPAGIFVLAKTGVAAKKRYALIGEDGQITIRGFERVRRDWSPVAKETQEAVLHAILAGRDAKRAVEIVRKTVADLRAGTVPKERLVIYSQITRPLDAYEQVGPHVAAAKKIVARGGSVHEGTVVGYVITRKGGGSISERAEPEEDAKDYDPDYYINNQVLPAALRVLAGIGVTEDDLLSDTGKQHSLQGFLRK